MNYFEFERRMNSPETIAIDDDGSNQHSHQARQNTPPAPHGMQSSAKVIAEFSKKDKILSAEEILEHRKHCRARPGNCPFEKARDEADEISPKDIKVTKQTIFNRFATLLTQMFNMSKNLAKPAIAEPAKVEAKVNPTPSEASASTTTSTTAQDEAPESEPNPEAKLVAEIIESGIQRMVDMAKSKGCTVNMDEKKSKYIVAGPKKEQIDP